jgi:hypothetical protein
LHSSIIRRKIIFIPRRKLSVMKTVAYLQNATIEAVHAKQAVWLKRAISFGSECLASIVKTQV